MRFSRVRCGLRPILMLHGAVSICRLDVALERGRRQRAGKRRWRRLGLQWMMRVGMELGLRPALVMKIMKMIPYRFGLPRHLRVPRPMRCEVPAAGVETE